MSNEPDKIDQLFADYLSAIEKDPTTSKKEFLEKCDISEEEMRKLSELITVHELFEFSNDMKTDIALFGEKSAIRDLLERQEPGNDLNK